MVHTKHSNRTQERSIQKIKLQGSPQQRAKTYGKKAKKRIHKSIEFYKDICRKKGYNLKEQGRKYVEPIQTHNKKYYQQLKIIAKHAEANFYEVIGVNARTEIKSLLENECTSLYDPRSKILAQNWDWGAKSEEHTVLLEIQRENKPDITTITEAGMLAKIGMNSAGIGICLNALRTYKERKGVPIHILLRTALEQKTVKDVIKTLEKAKIDTAGNILVAHRSGTYIDLEIEHKKIHRHKTTDNIYIHTNHYLATDITKKSLDIHQSSLHRYEKAVELTQNTTGTMEDVKKILYNKENKEYPILREYYNHKLFGNYGTVLTTIMDLKNNNLYIDDDPHDTKELQKISYNW